MEQIALVQDSKQDERFELGRAYCLHLHNGPRGQCDLYHRGSLIKRVNLADKVELRIFVVELLQNRINQSRLAKILKLSRQSLHNYRESFKEFGAVGLLHGYSPSITQNGERGSISTRRPGSKASELAALRRARKAQPEAMANEELTLEGELASPDVVEEQTIEGILHVDQSCTRVMEEGRQSSSQVAAEQTSTNTATERVIKPKNRGMTSQELAAWRASLGLSQRAAAAALGISLPTYGAMERGTAWGTGKPVIIDKRTELACLAISAGLTLKALPELIKIASLSNAKKL